MVGKKCIVWFCQNRENEGSKLNFFRITKDRKELWLRALGRNPSAENLSSSRICSEHFCEDEYIESRGKTILRKDAIPTRNLKLCEVANKNMVKSELQSVPPVVSLDIPNPSSSGMSLAAPLIVKKEDGWSRLPTNIERRILLTEDNMQLVNWTLKGTERVCSKHFENTSFNQTDLKGQLLDQAIPTFNPVHATFSQSMKTLEIPCQSHVAQPDSCTTMLHDLMKEEILESSSEGETEGAVEATNSLTTSISEFQERGKFEFVDIEAILKKRDESTIVPAPMTTPLFRKNQPVQNVIELVPVYPFESSGNADVSTQTEQTRVFDYIRQQILNTSLTLENNQYTISQVHLYFESDNESLKKKQKFQKNLIIINRDEVSTTNKKLVDLFVSQKETCTVQLSTKENKTNKKKRLARNSTHNDGIDRANPGIYESDDDSTSAGTENLQPKAPSNVAHRNKKTKFATSIPTGKRSYVEASKGAPIGNEDPRIKNEFHCSHCSTSFGLETDLNLHIKYCRPRPFGSNSPDKSIKLPNQQLFTNCISPGSRVIKCIMCEDTFTDFEVLKKHLLSHNESEDKSPPCVAEVGTLKEFESYIALHPNSESKSTFVCCDCKQNFSSLEILKQHLPCRTKEIEQTSKMKNVTFDGNSIVKDTRKINVVSIDQHVENKESVLNSINIHSTLNEANIVGNENVDTTLQQIFCEVPSVENRFKRKEIEEEVSLMDSFDISKKIALSSETSNNSFQELINSLNKDDGTNSIIIEDIDDEMC